MIIRLISILIFTGSSLAFSSSEKCSGPLTSLANAKKMYAARGSEADKFFREVPHYIRIRYGMPSNLQIVASQEKVFRHYTSQQGLKKILESKVLRAGGAPFYYSGSLSDYNVDLTGIFITTPEVRPHSIGVRPENLAYVDFTLPYDTGILFIRNDILLIPGTSMPEQWKVDIYRGERRAIFQDYAEEFARWDKDGIPDPITIPIEIIAHSQ